MWTLSTIFLRKLLCKKVLICVVCYAALCADLTRCSTITVDPKQCLVWGPGLKSHFNVPVRYFYIQAVDTNGEK